MPPLAGSLKKALNFEMLHMEPEHVLELSQAAADLERYYKKQEEAGAKRRSVSFKAAVLDSTAGSTERRTDREAAGTVKPESGNAAGRDDRTYSCAGKH